MSKKTTGTLAVALMLGLGISMMPAVAFGAYNDVTLTTDTVITVAGINLNISGSSAVVQSITVDANNFSFVILNNSTITVSSTDRRVMSTDVSKNYTTSTSCTSSASVTTFASSDTSGSVTVTVTPTADTCAVPSTPTSSSGRSLGRSSAVVSTSDATTLALLQAKINMLMAQISAIKGSPSPQAFANASLNASFKRSLSPGSSGEDVKNLQKFLNGQGFVISVSGAGSLGNETVFFGAFTKAALIKFQIANGIEGIGIMGPITRAKIKELSK